MQSQNKAEVKEIPSEIGSNKRSTIEFPYSDLDSSIQLVQGVHDVGGNTCQYDQLAAQLGLEPKGGGFRIRVNSAETYGLLTYERGGRISLTDLGIKIIDSQYERESKVKAFLGVPLFKEVYNTFKGSQLPPQKGFERAIVNLGVGDKVADRARQVLLRSAKQAGFFDFKQDRLIEPSIRSNEPPKDTKEKQKGNDGGNNGGAGGNGGGGEQHLLIQGLLSTLPKPNTEWSIQDRMNWLVMANSILKIINPSNESGDVEIKLKNILE